MLYAGNVCGQPLGGSFVVPGACRGNLYWLLARLLVGCHPRRSPETYVVQHDHSGDPSVTCRNQHSIQPVWTSRWGLCHQVCLACFCNSGFMLGKCHACVMFGAIRAALQLFEGECSTLSQVTRTRWQVRCSVVACLVVHPQTQSQLNALTKRQREWQSICMCHMQVCYTCLH